VYSVVPVRVKTRFVDEEL